jgi:hypothetical protein
MNKSLVFGLVLLLCVSFASATYEGWIEDNTINASIGNYGVDSYASPFYKSGTLYLIVGNNNDEFLGYNWSGTAWQEDIGINASIPYTGFPPATPTVFNWSGDWYLINGLWGGVFTAFKWNGSLWQENAEINKSLTTTETNPTPYVFSKDGDLYLISGNEQGSFLGYKWNGTEWQEDISINASLPDLGEASAPTVFYKDGTWYLISAAVISDPHFNAFYGFEYNGSSWVENIAINKSLPYVSHTFPHVFYKDAKWQMLLGADE